MHTHLHLISECGLFSRVSRSHLTFRRRRAGSGALWTRIPTTRRVPTNPMSHQMRQLFLHRRRPPPQHAAAISPPPSLLLRETECCFFSPLPPFLPSFLFLAAAAVLYVSCLLRCPLTPLFNANATPARTTASGTRPGSASGAPTGMAAAFQSGSGTALSLPSTLQWELQLKGPSLPLFPFMKGGGEQNIQRRGPGRFYSERGRRKHSDRARNEYTSIATGRYDWVEDSLQWSGSVPCQLKNPFQLMTLVT